MSKGATIFIAVVAFIIVLLLGYTLIYGMQDSPISDGESVTMQGTYICLPHQDTSGSQTLECAFGLQTDDGENYALDLNALTPGTMADVQTDDSIEVTGTLTQRDQLESNDSLRKYAIAGVVHVMSIAQVGDGESTEQHTVAGGALSFERPDEFGLAVTQDQVLVDSVVPPCEAGFDYCLYYNESTYINTNFESAGLRIEARPDLAAAESCLTSAPSGYSSLVPEIRRETAYAVSTFSPIQDSGAGHSAQGILHRLEFADMCYEFETRIGVSQIAAEQIATEPFTQNDRGAVENGLQHLLENIRLTERDEHIFTQ